MKKLNKKQGFTILFAVLVSSLVLAIGIGIINITLKEITLSSAGRESQFAFYAADSGSECARYWDNQEAFATTTGATGTTTLLYCGGHVINSSEDVMWNVEVDEGKFATTTFRMLLPSNQCADVKVIKTKSGDRTITTIDSRGYNTCDLNSKLRLERGYRVTYI